MLNKFIGLLLFFTLLQSCGTNKGYPGEKKPKSELATIYTSERQEYDGGEQFILMEMINEVEVGNSVNGWPRKVETLPGEVTIKFKFDTSTFGKSLALGLSAGLGGAVGGAIAASAQNENGLKNEFTATVEKGKSYRIAFFTDTHSLSDLKVWLEPYTPVEKPKLKSKKQR